LIESETLLNKLDSSCGDGDCGLSLKQASEGNYIIFNELIEFLLKIIGRNEIFF
jgi:hypothetical protein